VLHLVLLLGVGFDAMRTSAHTMKYTSAVGATSSSRIFISSSPLPLQVLLRHELGQAILVFDWAEGWLT